MECWSEKPTQRREPPCSKSQQCTAIQAFQHGGWETTTTGLKRPIQEVRWEKPMKEFKAP
eukprot:6016432-Amphidinium_carterae.1